MLIAPYKKYKHVLEYPRYELGVFDCFTVLRDFLNSVFGIMIPNYARPDLFHLEPLCLAEKILREDIYIQRESVDFKTLKVGDILLFCIGSQTYNHIGVYLGNGLFLHQMQDCIPREDNLSVNWFRRLRAVYYHMDVPQDSEVISNFDLLTDHQKVQMYVHQR